MLSIADPGRWRPWINLELDLVEGNRLMEQEPFGIGIIGAGHIVKRHASAYRSLPQLARLVAVADIDLKRADAAKERFGFAQAYEDYRELLKRGDVEVVSVCTPAHCHARIAIDAIEAGKHVLCEKPMATTLADADDIIKACQQRPGPVVSFVFQLRSDPTHRRMKRMIELGHIGRVLKANLTVRLRKKPAYYTSAPGRGSWKSDGGGVLINQAIHQLDGLISFLGEPVQASAVMDTFVQPCEAEDTIVGWVKFKSGAFATIDCTVCAHEKNFSIEVTGENAGMRVSGNPDGHMFAWQVKAPGSAARKAVRDAGLKECPPPPKDPPKWKLQTGKLVSKSRRREWQPPAHWEHTPHVREFLEAARAGAGAPIPPAEARRSIELAAALYESAIKGRVVSLPLDSGSTFYHGVTADGAASIEREAEAVVTERIDVPEAVAGTGQEQPTHTRPA